MNAQNNDAPLTGVTVVERGHSVAASYAGRILALMGATVIKVEDSDGDVLRHSAPSLGGQFDGGALFAYVNVNKSGVTIDLSTPQGRVLLDELLARADIFLDDTHPADRRTLGIAPSEVCRKHAKLVYASVLPFGALGAHSEFRGYEIGGQLVDVSVQDANVAISCFALQRLGEGVLEHRHARSFQYGGVLECSDGHVQLLTLEQHQWEGLVKLMGDPAWALEPDLHDPIKRAKRGKDINHHIRAWAKLQRIKDIVERGQALDVPLAKYNGPQDIIESEQTREREMFVPVKMAGLGALPVLMAPFQYTLPDNLAGCPSQAGVDNARILGEWLGHTPAELAQFRQAGAI